MTTPMSELGRFLPDVYKARLEAEKAARENAASTPAASCTPASAPVLAPVLASGP